MAKIKPKVKAKTLTAKQKADAAKKAKEKAKAKALSKVIAKDKAIKKSVAAKKAKPKGEGRAVGKDVQKKQQESKMATPVGKGRIAESVKGSLNTRPAFMRSLLKPSKGKGASEGDARLQKLDAQIKGLEDKMKSKGKGGPSTPRVALMKLINQRMQLKKAMDETKGLEAPRKALQALRMKEEKLREALKKATTDAQKAKIKKQIEAIQRKMDARGNMGKQGGKRYGKKVVSLKGGKVDVSKIKKRMAKGGKV